MYNMFLMLIYIHFIEYIMPHAYNGIYVNHIKRKLQFLLLCRMRIARFSSVPFKNWKELALNSNKRLKKNVYEYIRIHFRE